MAEATTLPGYNRVAAHRNQRSLVFDIQSKPVYSNKPRSLDCTINRREHFGFRFSITYRFFLTNRFIQLLMEVP